jgi:uncharacterized protein (DUF2141 family)
MPNSTRYRAPHRCSLRSGIKGLMVAVVAWCCALQVQAQTQDAGDLTLQINVLGLNSSRGQVVANLFLEGDDVFGQPRAKQTQAIVEKHAQLTFQRLKAGRYAVIVFHDINGNNDLDHNLFHFPAEPLGYSNGFELTLFSGLPNSHKLAFDISSPSSPINITVK